MTDLRTSPAPGSAAGSADGATPRRARSLVQPQLPRTAPLLAGTVALGVGALVALLAGTGPVALLAVAWVVYAVGLPAWSRAVEGPRTGS